MRLKIEKPVTVITPTIGSTKLFDAINSVAGQTYKNVRHLVVFDGPVCWEDFQRKYANVVFQHNVQIVHTPDNTGGSGFYGHRIFAAYPHLINSDYIAFLDDDNWYEPNHIETLVETVENKSLDFAYSFRKIYDANKNYLVDDNCESLGKWPVWPALGVPIEKIDSHFPYLIDTSSFLFRRDFIKSTCHLWHSGWGGDRRFFTAVKDNCEFDTNGLHSLCYRLAGNSGSVTKEFFEKGNKETLNYYKGKLPWQK